MKTWISGFALGVSVMALAHNAQAAKAMDCSECREHYAESPDESCQPICGPLEVPAKKAIKLYAVVSKASGMDCGGMNKCGSEMTHFTCNWGNAPGGRPIACSFLDNDQKEKHIGGAKAQKLADAIDAVMPSESDAGAGTAGYVDSRDVNCVEHLSEGHRNSKKVGKVECTVAVSKESSDEAETPELPEHAPVPQEAPRH